MIEHRTAGNQHDVLGQEMGQVDWKGPRPRPIAMDLLTATKLRSLANMMQTHWDLSGSGPKSRKRGQKLTLHRALAVIVEQAYRTKTQNLMRFARNHPEHADAVNLCLKRNLIGEIRENIRRGAMYVEDETPPPDDQPMSDEQADDCTRPFTPAELAKLLG